MHKRVFLVPRFNTGGERWMDPRGCFTWGFAHSGWI